MPPLCLPSVQEFEYTPECCIFDLLHVRLYHGWLVEPDEPDVQRAVAQCGYNQLVDKIITNKSSDDPELSHQGESVPCVGGKGPLLTQAVFREEHYGTLWNRGVLFPGCGYPRRAAVSVPELGNLGGNQHPTAINFPLIFKTLRVIFYSFFTLA